jgi:hypothetical protein
MMTNGPSTLFVDLRSLVELDERDSELNAALRAQLVDRAHQHDTDELRSSRRRVRPRWRTAAALAAAVVAAAAVSVSLVGGAGKASAQAVLRRAAAVRFGADQGLHFLYSVDVTRAGRSSAGTGDVWVETDGAGVPTQVAETLRLSKEASDPPLLVTRDVQTPAGVYSYDTGDNAILVPSSDDPNWSGRQAPTVPLPAFLFNGATVAQRLQELAAGAEGGAQLVGRQTLDGVPVDVVEVDGWPNGDALRTSFYFDAQSHVLRGFDVVGTDPSHDTASWRVRLVSNATTSSESVPAGTFTLGAPTDAWVQVPPFAMDAVASLCPPGIKPLLVQGESLLDVCRSTTPGLTEDALLSALSGSAKADLDAAVAAGQITGAQADQALVAQRAQLREFVTGTTRPIPIAKGPVRGK